MSNTARASRSTPTAIIEAAERLFGSHGIENVSLRQVGLEAGAANNSAVTYHFRDRQSLVRAIWLHRLPVLDAHRRAMIDALPAEQLARDPHGIMRVLVMPNYHLRDAAGVNRYSAFFRHALRWQEGQRIRNDLHQSTPASVEALDLLRAHAPDVPHRLLMDRLRLGCCGFFDMVVERDAEEPSHRTLTDEDAFVREGIDMIVAICLRPLVR